MHEMQYAYFLARWFARRTPDFLLSGFIRSLIFRFDVISFSLAYVVAFPPTAYALRASAEFDRCWALRAKRLKDATTKTKEERNLSVANNVVYDAEINYRMLLFCTIF